VPRPTSFHRWVLSTAIGPFAVLLSVSCWPVEAHAGSRRSTLSTIPQVGSSRLESEDRDLDETWAPSASGSRGFRSRSTGRFGYGTDNAKRIQRFWSRYRGRRSEPKSKPVEREK
jgi:hypothetical protein